MTGDSTIANSTSSPVGPGTEMVCAPPRRAAFVFSSGAPASRLAMVVALSVYARYLAGFTLRWWPLRLGCGFWAVLVHSDGAAGAVASAGAESARTGRAETMRDTSATA